MFESPESMGSSGEGSQLESAQAPECSRVRYKSLVGIQPKLGNSLGKSIPTQKSNRHPNTQEKGGFFVKLPTSGGHESIICISPVTRHNCQAAS